MDENFQREGSKSNAYVGSEFEKLAMKIFHDLGVPVVKNFPVDVGVGNKKRHINLILGLTNHLCWWSANHINGLKGTMCQVQRSLSGMKQCTISIAPQINTKKYSLCFAIKEVILGRL